MFVDRRGDRYRYLMCLTVSLLLSLSGTRSPAQGAGTITVPITIRGVHIFVESTVDGKPVTLVLDTGAGGNVITPQAATRLQLTPGKGQVSVEGAGGSAAAVSRVTLAKLGVGAALSEKQDAFLIPLPEAIPCDGLLGTPFLQEWVVTIDYAQSRLTLTPPGSFTPPAGASAFPMRLQNNTPELEAIADGYSGWFHIDTGGGEAITLFSPFVEKNHLRGKYSPALQMITGRGVGGLVSGDVVRLPQFVIGPFRFLRPVAELSRQKEGVFAAKDTAGNLGGELWKRFTVTLDYGNKKIYLVPNTQYAQPFIGNRSGLAIDVAMGAYIVRFVIPNSPASEAGIQVGDKILAVDDKPAEALKYGELPELLRRDVGAKLRLRLQTMDHASREVTLTLRDLL